MNDVKIKDWFIFGQWYDISWFHTCYFNGQFETIKERLGYGLSQIIAEQNKNVQRIFFSKSEWQKIGRRYLKEVLDDPVLLKNILNDIRTASNDLIEFSREIDEIDFNELNKNEYIDLFKKFHNKHHAVWALGQVPNVLELENSYLTDYIKGILKDRGLSKEKIIEYFQILSTPRELSHTQLQEHDMLELVCSNANNDLIQKHWKKYRWLHFGWVGPSLSLDYFTEVYDGLAKEGKAKKYLDEINRKNAELIKNKGKILAELNFDEKTSTIVRLLEELFFIKALRVEAVYICYSCGEAMLKKIAKDNYLSLKQVYSIYSDWLIKMIETNSVDPHYINDIAKYSVRYFDGEKEHLLIGKEAEKIMEKINIPEEAREVDALNGECAFPGNVKGKVSVVNKADEMDKFDEGDILVSYVTDPSLLPIMKKAKAFVTNTGGLTCHAAIVARELETPCVVGTKIATKVLKDGDIVEVDATNGIVKKL